LNRCASGSGLFEKVSIQALQRMETPVIYFYSDEPRSVDVSVNFPQGFITEWYPQAAQIGPSVSTDAACKGAAIPQSGARWSHVEILPAKAGPSLASALPSDRSGSHYFAARETDAAYLRVATQGQASSPQEQEKFIFYRGTGNFSTPLRVTTTSGNSVTVANNGSEPLVHLFVLGLEQRAGQFIHIDRLAPGKQRTVQLDVARLTTPLESLSGKLAKEMATALASQGLYAREASAMVNTWKDSWFAEDGLRVLYVLPRAWTDRTLPLAVTPAPRELVRVMVGRAEVLAPTAQQQLSTAISQATGGDSAARSRALAEIKTLGRFAEPAIQLATVGADKKTSQMAWQLFQDVFLPTVSASAPPPKLAASSPYE
jgi:hypothetical protein